MIEKMKVVSLVAEVSRRKELLDTLRNLGVVHFSEKKSADSDCIQRFSQLSSIVVILQEYLPKSKDFHEKSEILDDIEFEKLFDSVTAALERKSELLSERSNAVSAADKLRQWGNFVPSEFDELRKEGIDLHIYRIDKKTLSALAKDPDARYIRLASVDKMITVAVLGTLSKSYSANEFVPPQKGLFQLESEIQEYDRSLAECESLLKDASLQLPSFRDRMLTAQNDSEYSSISNTTESDSGLVWISGYIPESDLDTFRAAASEHHWAWALDDPSDNDDKVPTKVKYNKVTRLMIPIFDILGIVPGYREYDISFWFLGFFTLFFAMILGDAGYGCLLLIGAILLTVKTKKLSDVNMLLWVLSIATIIWGALTGTWFGFEEAMEIPLLKSMVIPSFANYPEYFNVSTTVQQNSIMQFCFILGTVQLSLACVINVRHKLKEKDLSLFADIGWLCAICALYFLVLFLVIGSEIAFTPVAIAVIVGFLLVVLFGGMAPGKSISQGIKSGLGDAFTVFLNTISAFGNIMSYIRLFAVGMASLAIAQSFNNMALGFSGPMVIAGILIILLGHALNLVMGLLSVVVHGIRLNLLEFSGQLGMEWAGTAYEPFKKLDKIKK